MGRELHKRFTLLALAIAVTASPVPGCGSVPLRRDAGRSDSGGGQSDSAAPGGDAGVDVPSLPGCNPSKPFGAPTIVANVNDTSADDGAGLADDVTMYFVSQRPGGPGSWDIYVATRSSVLSPFIAPHLVPGINSAAQDLWPRVTPDLLTMYYTVHDDIYVTQRTATMLFAQGSPVPQVNTTDNEGDPFLAMNGQALYLVSSRPGGAGEFDIYVSLRGNDGTYGAPQAVSELNSSVFDSHPAVTADGLTIYWGSNRSDQGSSQGFDVWKATRASTADRFSDLGRVAELNSDANEYPTWISGDGCRMYLTSDRPGGPGGGDIWEAVKPP